MAMRASPCPDRRYSNTVGSRPVASRFWRRVLWVALACGTGCDGCNKLVHGGDTPMCGVCARSSDCRSGLACVNRVCETAPPSCHVQIGL